jgi:hypothetical protein
MDDVHRFAVEECGVEDDSALRTILTAQHTLLPSRDRTYPGTVQLEHDFQAWHRAMIEAKEAGHYLDWPERVPRLRTFGPSTLTVDDPAGFASMALGASIETHGYGTNWELASPVARTFASKNAEEIVLSA